MSHNELHTLLWEASDRRNRVELHQRDFAARHNMHHTTLSHLVRHLKEEGRIKKISSKQGNIGTYVVRDPADWPHEWDPYPVPGFAIERCRTCDLLYELGPHFPPRA